MIEPIYLVLFLYNTQEAKIWMPKYDANPNSSHKLSKIALMQLFNRYHGEVIRVGEYTMAFAMHKKTG